MRNISFFAFAGFYEKKEYLNPACRIIKLQRLRKLPQFAAYLIYYVQLYHYTPTLCIYNLEAASVNVLWVSIFHYTEKRITESWHLSSCFSLEAEKKIHALCYGDLYTDSISSLRRSGRKMLPHEKQTYVNDLLNRQSVTKNTEKKIFRDKIQWY